MLTKEKTITAKPVIENDGKLAKVPLLTLADIEGLGLTQAVQNIRAELSIGDNPELRRKLRTAFEFYRVVTPENLKQFNDQLCTKTIHTYKELIQGYSERYHRVRVFHVLHLCTLGEYPFLPPQDVLMALAEAKAHKCFDTFVIATLQKDKDIKLTVGTIIRDAFSAFWAGLANFSDPILFGMINESPNLYFIAQWGEDVKIEDILKEDEG